LNLAVGDYYKHVVMVFKHNISIFCFNCKAYSIANKAKSSSINNLTWLRRHFLELNLKVFVAVTSAFSKKMFYLTSSKTMVIENVGGN